MHAPTVFQKGKNLLTYRVGPYMYSRRERNVPHPCDRMERFRPDFCRTFRPGDPFVPRALLVMFRIFRSSTTTTAWVSPIEVEALWRKSRRMLATRSWALATRIFCFRTFRLFGPFRYCVFR